tara:strand:+ start:321 stop:761 length:441 start_codon:yes stop_codon:yes gene_type:complete
MMNILRWIIVAVLLTGCQTTKAEQTDVIETVQIQTEEPKNFGGPKAQLYSKPVLCAPTLEEAMEMLSQIKVDGMKPLMYFRGNSFNGDGSKFMSDFFILYDPEDEQVTIVERQDYGMFTCIVSGGTGDVQFDPEEIKSLIGWDDIP